MGSKEDSKSIIRNSIDFRRFVRGTFMEDVSELEVNISNIIAMYFCKTKRRQNEFLEIILNERMTFGVKIQILEKILQLSFKSFLKKIKGINSFRTKMAHAVGDREERKVFNKDEEYITIATFKNGKMIKEKTTIKEITDKQNDVYYLKEQLLSLWIAFLLPKKYSTRES